ncbi:MAG: glutamate-5-semialdehyde dehydrogenase [Planctomycetota bacterium]
MWRARAVQLADAARQASGPLARAGSALKNGALLNAADLLDRRKKAVLAANAGDLKAGRASGLSSAMLDRLEITPKRLGEMRAGLGAVASLPDPVGETIRGWRRPNGLQIRKVRIPLGVLFLIYESRPNVTIDAGGLALKSGNSILLRGGREALHSNLALGAILAEALRSVGLPQEAIQVIDTPDRALVTELLKLDGYIDVVIPRGGKDLIRAVLEESTIPVLRHLDGVCHVYVDADADLAMAERIALNAKVQRPGVCNAMETLLVHRAAARRFLPSCLKALQAAGVELRGCPATRRAAKGVKILPAGEEDWTTEYLDLILSVKVVRSLDEAIRHINAYGSRHTDAIVTNSLPAADRFCAEVDSASVMVNASTRFSDGFEYGLGAEMGISTNKLHARGPVGLEELTTYKYLVDGRGHIRE